MCSSIHPVKSSSLTSGAGDALRHRVGNVVGRGNRHLFLMFLWVRFCNLHKTQPTALDISLLCFYFGHRCHDRTALCCSSSSPISVVAQDGLKRPVGPNYARVLVYCARPCRSRRRR